MNDTNTATKTLEVQIPGLIQPAIFAPKPVLSHTPLANPGAYYRSKIFTTLLGTNALTAAAAPILIMVSHLRTTPSELDSRELYLDLVHEIKAFETQAQTQGYRSETILLARYILCATLDEVILSSKWDKQEQWHKHKLLMTFHSEDWGGERVFLILDRLSADTSLYIDLLELIYLCLNLGFIGKYQLVENGKAMLDEVIEKLYQRIRWQRGDIKKELALHEQTQPTVVVNPIKTPTTQPLPLWLLGLFTVLLMTSVYSGFNFMLSSSVTPVFQQLTSILQTYAADS